MILDGKSVSKHIKLDLQEKIKTLERKLCLSVILIGQSKDSITYVNMKRRMCESLGVKFLLQHFDEKIEEHIVIKEIEKLNQDKDVDGILIQLTHI